MNLRKFQLLMSKYGFSIIIMVLELALIFWFFFWLGRWTPTLWIVFVILFSLATILAIVNRSMTPESNLALGGVCSSHWPLALFDVWRAPIIQK